MRNAHARWAKNRHSTDVQRVVLIKGCEATFGGDSRPLSLETRRAPRWGRKRSTKNVEWDGLQCVLRTWPIAWTNGGSRRTEVRPTSLNLRPLSEAPARSWPSASLRGPKRFIFAPGRDSPPPSPISHPQDLGLARFWGPTMFPRSCGRDVFRKRPPI